MTSVAPNKISTHSNPDADGKLARLRAASEGRNDRLQSMLMSVMEDDPLGQPDRPHPLPPILEGREPVVLRSVETPASQPLAHAALGEHASEQTGPVSEIAAAPPAVAQQPVNDQPPVIQEQAAYEPRALAPEPDVGSVAQSDQPPIAVRDDASLTMPEPHGRGRPLKGGQRKSETSYSLDPTLIKALRILAAHNQIATGRTVSTSEIVEVLLRRQMDQIVDNVVLSA